ncbi:MAG: DUF1016 N-terminal domain-containing protein [Candidatus Omnitrophica bacterium]|nr:DUF1016 N-terminal domain-containing protein [Candidatus Omnitrophota bacterium]
MLLPVMYQTLAKFIKCEIASSQKKIERTKIAAYWKIGEAISKHLLHYSDRAGYGDHIFEKLATDLEIAETTLRDSVRFHQMFPIPHARTELGWNHYRALLTIKDSDKRLEWQRRCAQKYLSARELKRQLALRIPKTKKKAPNSSAPTNPAKISTLVFSRGELGTLGVAEKVAIEPKKESIFVDFGFNILRELPRTQKLSGMINKKPQYTFKAYVEKIIDGDTLWSQIDCGFGTLTRQKLRLRGIDCPELNTKEGQRAKCFVTDAFVDCAFIVVQTHKSDKYDRYLADIFFLPHATDANGVAREGKLLNQALLDAGLAKEYD